MGRRTEDMQRGSLMNIKMPQARENPVVCGIFFCAGNIKELQSLPLLLYVTNIFQQGISANQPIQAAVPPKKQFL